MMQLKVWGLAVVVWGIAGACGGTKPNAGGTCDVEPICSAFLPHVSVSLDKERGVAVITSDGMPEHAAGPYGINPYSERAQDVRLEVPLAPTAGAEADTPRGAIAVAYNGVPIYHPVNWDDFGGCRGNAIFLEGFDSYGGHPGPDGNYHYHGGQFLTHAVHLGLRHVAGEHSSLVGYALDGFPIYGPFGYVVADDATSGVQALRSCYRLQEARTCCADEGVCGLQAMSHEKTLALGAFVEDHVFDAAAYANGACELNAFNMRFQATPEYPEGTWAYVVTLDAAGAPTFPYLIGLRYYGQGSR
jgi:hypothetical protein